MLHRRWLVVLACVVSMGCSTQRGHLLSSVRELAGGRSSDDSDESNGSSQAKAAGAGSQQNEIVQTAAVTDPAASPTAATPTGEIAESIIARVNGEAILAEEVFAPIRAGLAKAQQEMPPAEFARLRNQAIQRQLRDLIERQLIIQEAKKQLPEQAIKLLEGMADKEFAKRLEPEMKRMEVNTEAELRRKLLENGESLDQMRETYRVNSIARQFLARQLSQRLTVSREEMLDYYNAHLDQYSREEGVRWSEIQVSFAKHGSLQAARAKTAALVQQLRDGDDFAELAASESDGPTAAQGGRWELTTRGSYIVAAVDQAIFTLPVGQVSDPIEGPQAWHIVRVDEKIAGGSASFVEVQDEIRKAVREEKGSKESQRYVQELARKAHITTVFDKPNPNVHAQSRPTNNANPVKLGEPQPQ